MHLPGKYRDLLYGIGAEEFGHVEMLATMSSQLLEKAPLGVTESKEESPRRHSEGRRWREAVICG